MAERKNESQVYKEQSVDSFGQGLLPSKLVEETSLRKSSRKAQQGVNGKSLQTLLQDGLAKGMESVEVNVVKDP